MAAPTPPVTPPVTPLADPTPRLLINDRAGIRETFKAHPDLKEVHILADGSHYFSVPTVELTEGLAVTMLPTGDAELED